VIGKPAFIFAIAIYIPAPQAIIIRATRERYARGEAAAARANVVRRCHVKRFLVNVRCAEEVMRIICGEPRRGPPKNQNPESKLISRDVSDVNEIAACGYQAEASKKRCV
jgi:hypothetical protein